MKQQHCKYRLRDVPWDYVDVQFQKQIGADLEWQMLSQIANHVESRVYWQIAAEIRNSLRE